MSLAYQVGAMMLMLAEATFVCRQTGQPLSAPFQLAEVRGGSHVGPPTLSSFSGSVVTGNYFFGFGDGHLANFRRRGFTPAGTEQEVRERNLELSKLPSLIDEAGALTLATNWLAALEIAVPQMERKYRRSIVQWRFHPEATQQDPLMLPVYQVQWIGNPLRTRPEVERPVVIVTVFGATKELVSYSVLDDSLFLRPPINFAELKKMASVPDDQFRVLTTEAVSNLVMRAAGQTNWVLPEFSIPVAPPAELDWPAEVQSSRSGGVITTVPPKLEP